MNRAAPPALLGAALAPASVRAARRNPWLAILAADLRQRTRSTRFRVVALLAALAAWGCFPPLQAGYLVLAVDEHWRGFYSSAWIGMVLATMTLLWSLAGFYGVRGTLQRDFDTRVWQLLGASSMSRAGYLAAKWTSHLLVLLAILAGTLAVGLVAQWVRAEDRRVDLWELAKPSLLLALPILAAISTFAIWFDLVPWLRRTAGNVLFFFVWVAAMSTGAATASHEHGPGREVPSVQARAWTSDLPGITLIERSLEVRGPPQAPGKAQGLCIGCGATHGVVGRFSWVRWDVSAAAAWGRVLWLAAAVAGMLLGVPFLDAAASRAGPSGTVRLAHAPRPLRWLGAALAPLRRFPSGVLVAAEIDVLLRMRPLWWWAAWLPLWAVQAGGSREAVALAMLGGWTLLLDAFSRAGLREQEHRTGELVWTARGAAGRLMRARAAMLFGLATVAAAPGLLHAALGAPDLLAPALAIAASLALGSLAAGTLARSSRPFELAFLVAAYATTQGAPWLDASRGPGVALWHAAAALAAVALLTLPGGRRG